MRYYTYPCWRAYFLETTPNTLLFLPYLLVQEITINKGDEVYYMPSTNSAIQICRGCREKAAKQVGGKNNRRPVIPKGHLLNIGHRKHGYAGVAGLFGTAIIRRKQTDVLDIIRIL